MGATLVSIPWKICDRGALRAAIKAPKTRPIDMAADTNSEFWLARSTRFPMINPKASTTKSDTRVPVSHAVRSTRRPKIKISFAKEKSFQNGYRTIN